MPKKASKAKSSKAGKKFKAAAKRKAEPRKSAKLPTTTTKAAPPAVKKPRPQPKAQKLEGRDPAPQSPSADPVRKPAAAATKTTSSATAALGGGAAGAGATGSPEAMAQNMMRLSELTSKAVQIFMQRAGGEAPQMPDMSGAQEATRLAGEISRAWMTDPMKLAESQGTLVKGYMDLWQATVQRLGGGQATPIAEADRGDVRFRHPDWTENPYFDFWKQAYLLTSRWAETTLHNTPGLDQRTQAKAEFIQKQIISALAPSNFMSLNPEVIQETIKSNGRNLVDGMTNFVKDLERSGQMLKISQTDTSAFEVGRNVATMPGKVVFQNDLLQLIQYSPTTPDVHEVPFVIVPPWINKYYILDLTPERSFIKFVVDQGFTTFVVSWVNPDERLKDKTFADYMTEGLLEAVEAAKRECGSYKANVLGYCIGGTLLGSTLAWLAEKNESPFNSATFLVAQVDFTKAGDLKLFIDDEQLKGIERLIDEKGYLEGSRMATVFNMLRPKDLIWPYVVNNYMLGKKPMAFDLLYWNQDSTRMPGANHKFYLREFYHENKLARGEMELAGERLDLGRIRLPVFHLATREDHISPPRSVFTGAKLFGGPVEFVLAGSGHIAGVVSPPGKTKYPYWVNKRPLSHPDCSTLDDWIAGADEIQDSWWPHWAKWLRQYSGSLVRARKPGSRLGVIEDAPGSYVKVMS